MSNQLGCGRFATHISGEARRPSCRGLSRMSQRLRGDRGQTVVEFAMVLPIVAALVIVLLQFGSVIYSYISLTHLVNEGARYGAVNIVPGGQSSLGGYICPKLDSAATSKKVVVSFTSATGTPVAGDTVTVTASENFKIIPYWGGATIPVSSSASMRLEQAPTYASGTTQCP